MILIALAFVALLAIVGLAIDVGRIMIALGSLQRAVDAASLAAASQFRETRTISEMEALADQVMNLNGVDPTTVIVEDCQHAPGDPELCVTPRRKYVRVTASVTVEMTFLNVIQIPRVTLTRESIAEAASVDVVLVIDISESMTSEASLCDNDDDDSDGVADDGRPEAYCSFDPADPLYNSISQVGGHLDNYLVDPSACNPGDDCQPFEKVRAAASSFVSRILDLPIDQESDRIAIVQFSNGWQAGAYGTRLLGPWTSDHAVAQTIIRDMKVYQPPECPTSAGICLNHDEMGNFTGIECPLYRSTDPHDPSSCTTTNIGGALRLAGNTLGDPAYMREEALWVVILLTDGAANASNADGSHPYGYCPQSDWKSPFCRDRLSATRHYSSTEPLLYDADDYARDNADFVGCYSPHPAAGCAMPGQSAVIFTIGLGPQVMAAYGGGGDIPHGVSLLRYVAAVGDDGDPGTDPCADLGLYDNEAEWKQWCGNYFFDATGDELNRVFEEIASRIFTRLTH